MPQLRYTTFDGLVRTFELKEGVTTVGRTPDNDCQIDELAVSARHCEIHCHGGGMIVRDVDSVAGLYVDGEPVTETELKVGQVLGLGELMVEVLDSGDSGTPPVIPQTPTLLADGSYSCLRHSANRAAYECEICFDLACQECVRPGAEKDGARQALCPSCGNPVAAIDWSGLTMTKRQALAAALPGKVKKTLEFWSKRRSKRE